MTRLASIAAALLALATPALAESHATGDAAKGEKEFRKCKSCHQIATDDETFVKGGRTGPNLHGVIGRQAASTDFRYGNDLAAAGAAGLVWDTTNLAEYAEDPRAFLRAYLDDSSAKSKMTFKMRKNSQDVAAFLATFSDAPAMEDTARDAQASE
ncbi:c-type cytochrome [Pseudooceanicola aestuarii]|uniref:c-type cytochrome n=1 Tax=Pseudooceanicola aestuarii TaxID=2697319 RepID=UPI0013D2F520|nr:c-type cytochrome [Pseudooceanicola aestuarii]